MESILLYRENNFISDLPPLFLPLMTKYYDGFISGEKRHELRRYGPRWNEKTCLPGRRVLLSCGYGKQRRCTGIITEFKKQHGTTFGSTYKAAITEVYGTLDVWIACFQIKLDEAKP